MPLSQSSRYSSDRISSGTTTTWPVDNKTNSSESFFQRFVMRARRKSYSPTPSASVHFPQQKPGLLATLFGTPEKKIRKKSRDEDGHKNQHNPLLERHLEETKTTANQMELAPTHFELCDEFLYFADDVDESILDSDYPIMAMSTEIITSMRDTQNEPYNDHLPEHGFALKTEIHVLMGPAETEPRRKPEPELHMELHDSGVVMEKSDVELNDHAFMHAESTAQPIVQFDDQSHTVDNAPEKPRRDERSSLADIPEEPVSISPPPTAAPIPVVVEPKASPKEAIPEKSIVQEPPVPMQELEIQISPESDQATLEIATTSPAPVQISVPVGNSAPPPISTVATPEKPPKQLATVKPLPQKSPTQKSPVPKPSPAGSKLTPSPAGTAGLKKTPSPADHGAGPSRGLSPAQAAAAKRSALTSVVSPRSAAGSSKPTPSPAKSIPSTSKTSVVSPRSTAPKPAASTVKAVPKKTEAPSASSRPTSAGSTKSASASQTAKKSPPKIPASSGAGRGVKK